LISNGIGFKIPIPYIVKKLFTMTETILDNPEVSNKNLQIPNPYPSILTRVKSMVIDWVFMLLLLVITSNIIGSSENFPVWIKVVLFLLIMTYEPILTSLGATLGQFIMGIRVRNIHNTNKKINLFFAFLRFYVKALLGWLSFIAISFTGKRRAIHDMAGMSVVVRK